MNVTIHLLPPLRVACVRAYGPYEQSGPQAWQVLTPWIARHGLLSRETMFLGFCHDDPQTTDAPRIRYDAAITLPDGFVPDDFVCHRTNPAQEYAVVLHTGAYATLPGGWAKLYWDWLPASGRSPASAPRMEQYLSGPHLPSDEDMTTRLYLPLIPL